MAVSNQTDRKLSSGSFMEVLAPLVAAFGGLMFGYDIGVVSGALLLLRDEFEMSCGVQELVVSSLLFGAIASSFLGGSIIDIIGRKYTMMFNAVVYMVGALILALASSVSFLLAGRTLLGLAIGLSVVAECAYISEISNSSHRGKLISLNEVAIAVGFLIAYLINFLCLDLHHGWRIMLGLSGVLAFTQFVGLVFVPRSPRFLMIKNKKQQAFQVLLKLRGRRGVAEEELSTLELSIDSEKSIGWRQFCSVRNNMVYRLALGFALVLFQQFSGQPTVLYYAPMMLEQVGFESNESATLGAVGAGIAKVVAVLASTTIIDKLGRKTLLITGCIGMAIPLFVMAHINKDFSPDSSSDCQAIMPFFPNASVGNSSVVTLPSTVIKTPYEKWLSLICILIYTASYSIGFGPVTWLILSEIFPSSIKGQAVAFIGSINWLANFIVSFTFLDYIHLAGVSGTFVTYGVSCCFAFVFIVILVPETKKRQLEEINKDINDMRCQEMLCRHAPWSRCCYKCSGDNMIRASSYELLSNHVIIDSQPLQNDK